MNYCTSCGTKLKKDDNFCTGCGAKIKKETNIMQVILVLGIVLVIFSSFVLGFISWNKMTELLRILFFVFETVLFLGISFFLKKLDNKSYIAFLIVGLILIPYTLSLIPYYNFLSLEGVLLYVYLAILYALTGLLYIFINKKTKNVVIDFLAITAFLFTIIAISDIFFIYQLSILFVVLFMYIISVLAYLTVINERMRKVLNAYSNVLFFSLVPFIIYAFANCDFSLIMDKIIGIGILLIYLVTNYFKIYKNSKTVISFISPLFITTLTCVLIPLMFDSLTPTILYFIGIVSILYYIISFIFDSKVFRIETLVFTYITLLVSIIIAVATSSHVTMLVLGILLLILNIYNILVVKYNVIHAFIPINIFIIISAIFLFIDNFKFIYSLLISIFIIIGIYSILKIKNNKYNLAYLITGLVLSIISTYSLVGDFSYINILVLLPFVFMFLLTNLFKENLFFRIFTYILLCLNTLLIFSKIDNGVYYGSLFISGITLVISFVLTYLKKIDLKYYMLFSEILLFIVTLTTRFDYPIYISFINIALFALSYLSIVKYFNKTPWRLANIMLGLLAIYKMFNAYIDQAVIANIISLGILIVILVILILLETEKPVYLTIISFVILIPYFNLVSELLSDTELGSNLIQFNILPFVIYTLVFSELIPFKRKSSGFAFTIIPLAILEYILILVPSNIGAIVFDIILSLFYIIYGLIKKYNYLVYFGIAAMLLSIIFRLFTVLNSVVAIIILIVIGFIFIGIALYKELKKKE